MSLERTSERTPLSEVLKKQGRLLEQIASDQTQPLELDDLFYMKDRDSLPWTDRNIGEVKDIVGWPTKKTWAGEPSVQFQHGESGDVGFFMKALEKSQAGNGEYKGLNNFWAIISTKPYAFDGTLPRSVNDRAYAPLPALIRAWTAFPDFMSALKQELSQVGASYQMADALTAQIEAEEVELLRASRLAYGLMTRLVARNDRELQAKLQDTMFPETAEPSVKRHFMPITDPSVELWT